MNSELDPKRSPFETLEEERSGTQNQPNVFLVAETYSIQRRPKAELAVAPKPQNYETTWMPKRMVQITVRSGFSSLTLFGGLLLASLAIYGAFTLTTISLWEWLSQHSLTGVAALAMLFGAQAIIGILFSIIEENDPVRLVGHFTQYVGGLVLYSGSFLIGGWLSTQWLRGELIPLLGKSTATFISVVALCITVQLVLNGLVRSYRAIQTR